MELLVNNFRHLIEAFGYSRVYNLSKKVSVLCLSCMEYVLEHELKINKQKEVSLQEFADSLFGPLDVSESDSITTSFG